MNRADPFTAGRRRALRSVALTAVLAGLLLSVTDATNAAAATISAGTPGVADGTVDRVDAGHHELLLSHGRQLLQVIVPPGAWIRVHGLPAPLSAVRPGMAAFVGGRWVAPGHLRGADIQAVTPSAPLAVLTGIVTTVDPVASLLVVQTGTGTRAVALVATGIPLVQDGRVTPLPALRIGDATTVWGHRDSVDRTELVATRTRLQSLPFAADLVGTVQAVDTGASRRLTLRARNGSSQPVAVPDTTPVLAADGPVPLADVPLGVTARVALARDAMGRPLRDPQGWLVTRLVGLG